MGVWTFSTTRRRIWTHNFLGEDFFLRLRNRSLSALVLSAVLIVSPLAAAAQAVDTTRAIVFPSVTSYGLDKEKVTLPADFAGPLNLLILSFEREQEKDADSWVPMMQQLGQANPGFHAYLLPVFPKENILYRWWLNTSLRSSSPSENLWRWTIPLYVNKTDFRHQLQIRDELQVVVLLADKTGKILWRGAGPYNDDKRAAINSLIQTGAGGTR